MTEEELRAFVKNNKENRELEYKLKPNFNDIKESMKEISNKMQFNIKRTIYAFANTRGGTLYVGIEDKSQTIKGLDDCDKETVYSIIRSVDEEIKLAVEEVRIDRIDRDVIIINVKRLSFNKKPRLLDGVLYVRENDKTRWIKKPNTLSLLYDENQLYVTLTTGIEKNLKNLIYKEDSFSLSQFSEGLKVHIRAFIEKNKITEYEESLSELEALLDQLTSRKADRLKLDPLADEIVRLYKTIISKA